MIRKELAIPSSVLEKAESFLRGKSASFEEFTISRKYDNIEINVILEQSNKKKKVINVYIGVTIGSSFPATNVFKVKNIFDLLKVYNVIFKEKLILIRFVPQGGKMPEEDYILNQPFLDDGMDVDDIINYVYYISFNDKLDLFYILYNLLLNEHYIIKSPTNVRTDLNLINLLTEKFEYYGYDNEFLLNNSSLEHNKSFSSSEMVLNKLIFHVLNSVLNNKKSGLSVLLLRALFDDFYTLVENERKCIS